MHVARTLSCAPAGGVERRAPTRRAAHGDGRPSRGRSLPARWRRRRNDADRVAAPEAWATPWASRKRRSRASGGPLGCRRIGSETFKLSADPQFVEKERDIVGLYLNPEPRDRAQRRRKKSGSKRSIAPARCCACALASRRGRRHDYIRHGTTSLFAALDVATGKVVGQCYRRHADQEFLTFPNRHRCAVAPRGGGAPHHGQLPGPTTSPQSEPLVLAASALPPAFHADECQLAESNRTVLCHHHDVSACRRGTL